jgi:putative ABC transport system permease protein
VVTVRRRGRDLALLRALGARPAQTAVSVLVMTLIIVVAAVVLGVPLGFFLGNVAWRTMADSLYVATDLAVPVVVTLLCLPVALVVGLLAAVVPTYRAGRLEVAEQLRRE